MKATTIFLTLTVSLAFADDYSWLTCDEFLDHAAAINRAFHVRDPRRVTGYSSKSCHRVFQQAQEHGAVHSIVNLGSFFRKHSWKDMKKGTTLPDVASEMKARGNLRKPKGSNSDQHGHRHLQFSPTSTVSDPTCDAPYGQGNPGIGSDATAILPCPDPLDLTDACPHVPCINTDDGYLKVTDVELGASNLSPNDDVFQSYEEWIPAYGGNSPYRDATASINGNYWNGCERDRTDADPVGELLVETVIYALLVLTTDGICDAIEDDFEIPVVCQDLPNPFKVGCEIAKAVTKGILLGLETAAAQIEFQDGLVDGAEVEAAYEHTKNLLDKQCAIFDQSVCRCIEESDTVNAVTVDLGLRRGSGCDGKDSNCNNLIDECDEDIVPPDIDIDDALCHCSNVWFPNSQEVEACVRMSTTIEDDCQNIKPNPSFIATNSCSESFVDIFAHTNAEELLHLSFLSKLMERLLLLNVALELVPLP